LTTIEQTSSILPTQQTTAAASSSMNFFHIKNMIELTVENARLREKQLENEIGKNKKKEDFSPISSFIS
jgi:hypothetical protein